MSKDEKSERVVTPSAVVEVTEVLRRNSLRKVKKLLSEQRPVPGQATLASQPKTSTT